MGNHSGRVFVTLVVIGVVGIGAVLGFAAVSADEPGGEDDVTFELAINNSGEVHSIGFPLAANATLADMFVNGTEGIGAVYTYEDGRWTHVTAFEDIEPGARDAFVVSTTGEGPDTIDLVVPFEPTNDLTAPDIERSVDEGWNFISAADCEGAEVSFISDPLGDQGEASVLVLDRFVAPSSPDRPAVDPFNYYVMGSADWGEDVPPVDPFKGYFAYFDEDSTVLKVEDPEDLC